MLPVDAFEPNPWGIIGCHGNVLEWVDRNNNPDQAMVKGGSFRSTPAELASSYVRYEALDQRQLGILGFRVVRNLTQEEWELLK
jgi:formylglycine-generating enzyme required for sulfatase activity